MRDVLFYPSSVFDNPDLGVADTSLYTREA